MPLILVWEIFLSCLHYRNTLLCYAECVRVSAIFTLMSASKRKVLPHTLWSANRRLKGALFVCFFSNLLSLGTVSPRPILTKIGKIAYQLYCLLKNKWDTFFWYLWMCVALWWRIVRRLLWRIQMAIHWCSTSGLKKITIWLDPPGNCWRGSTLQTRLPKSRLVFVVY